MKMKTNFSLRILTQDLMYGVIKNHKDLEENIKGHLEFCKGKSMDDVHVAIQNGLKMGHGKAEREIECVEMYLESVFKKIRNTTKK